MAEAPKSLVLANKLKQGPLSRIECERIAHNQLPKLISKGLAEHIGTWIGVAWYAAPQQDEMGKER